MFNFWAHDESKTGRRVRDLFGCQYGMGDGMDDIIKDCECDPSSIERLAIKEEWRLTQEINDLRKELKRYKRADLPF